MLVSGDSLIAVALRGGAHIALRRAHPDDAEDLIEIQRQVVAENVANVDDRIDTAEECRRTPEICGWSPKRMAGWSELCACCRPDQHF
jgi:hypothetical protein